MRLFFKVIGLVTAILFLGLFWDLPTQRGFFLFAAGYWAGRLVNELERGEEML